FNRYAERAAKDDGDQTRLASTEAKPT
ncbi:MAG: hypothetical protein RI998_1115, partial [Pseudomonadota bacterium]